MLLAAMVPAPAPAVVHEIVSAWCNGKDPLEPFGISREGSKNFAQPVRAGGVVQVRPAPELGAGAMLIDFDFSKPQIKIVPTGEIIPLGGGLFIEGFTLDPDHPAFGTCPKLQP
jgi:hypothetical protein